MRLIVFQDTLRVGGTERQSVAIATAAQKRGHEVMLLTNRPSKKIKCPPELFHHALQSSFLGIDSGIDEWAPGLDRVVKDFHPDVILCMGKVANNFIPQLKKIAPKIVGTVRTGKKISSTQIKNLSAAHLVITNSYVLQSLLTSFSLGVRTEVVGNGLLVDPYKDEAARMLLRLKMGAKPDTTVVLCLQRLIPGKGQHYLMESFLCATQKTNSPLNNSQLWIVGHGPFYWVLKAYAQVLDPKRIKVLRPEFPVGHYYNAADVAATVSHEDGLPNFLIEAHAFGLPAICEDYAGCGEVVVNGLTGLVSPVNEETMFIAQLQQLIGSPPLREFFGTNAQNLSFRFSFDRQMDRMLALLEGLK